MFRAATVLLEGETALPFTPHQSLPLTAIHFALANWLKFSSMYVTNAFHRCDVNVGLV